MSITFEDIKNAQEKIKDATIRTPIVRAARLSVHLGIDLYLKLENLQYTNAFKARGALNKLLTLSDEQRKNGVIACSAGNQRSASPAKITTPSYTLLMIQALRQGRELSA